MKRYVKKIAAMLCAAAVLSNIPASSAQAAVTSAQAIAKGIDVSKYQGAIDWASVAAQGYTFAFVKLGSSKSGIDPYFVPNMMGFDFLCRLRINNSPWLIFWNNKRSFGKVHCFPYQHFASYHTLSKSIAVM